MRRKARPERRRREPPAACARPASRLSSVHGLHFLTYEPSETRPARRPGPIPRTHMATAEARQPVRGDRPRNSDLYKAVALLAAAGLLLLFFRPVVELLLAFYAAAIIAVACNPIVERLPLPRWLAAFLLAVAILGTLTALTLLLLDPLSTQLRGLRAALPRLITFVSQQAGRIGSLLGFHLDPAAPTDWAASVVVFIARNAARYLLLLLLIFLAAIFFLARPNEQLLIPALRLFPERERAVVRGVLHELARHLRRYVLAVAISVGTTATLGSLMYWVIGVEFPLALGLLMGIGELVPFLGPASALIPGVLVALAESPLLALTVILTWAGIQLVQSHLIWPLIVSRAAELHPAVVLFGILLFGRLFGPLGVLLAVPLLMLFGVLIYDLWIERTVHTAQHEIPPLTEKG